MPKRKMSDEARKAASERMKAFHAEKKAAKEEETKIFTDPRPELSEPQEPTIETAPELPPDATPPSSPQPTVTLSAEQFQMMLDRIENKENRPATPQAVNQAFPNGAPSLNTQGGVVGVVERYPIDPRHYVSPVEELYETPALKRFGLRENFVIDWKVTPTKYQTAMGTWYIEPRFEIVLKKKQFDEDNNEIVKTDDNGHPYHPRIVLGRVSFFEDPPANILEAEQAGVSVDDLDKGEFQEKMRMYRYKFWLTEQLMPKRPKHTTSRRREEVIGGKVYEIEESSKPY